MNAIHDLLTQHLTQLCEVTGARPTGSDANKAATQYAAKVFRDLGFDVALQPFPCMDWKNAGAQFAVNGQAVEAVAAEYSLPCDVIGELVLVKNMAELKEAQLENAICVMYGDLCKEPLIPKNFAFWNPEEHQEIIRELEAKNPLAVITVSFLPDIPVPIIQDGDFTVPCAAVKGDLLGILKKSKGNATLRLMTERRPSEASNVIATYGKGKPKISFSAHIDTKPDTPGALDNGSGVAVLLTLASQIVGKEYPYCIEFALFNGEDYYSTPGEAAYMQTYLQTPGEYICAFNVDGVGMKESNTSYSFYECPSELETKIKEIAQAHRGIEQIDPWPMGDHMMFALSGVPAIAITSSGIFTLLEAVLHTPEDTLAQVDIAKLEQAVGFLMGCL